MDGITLAWAFNVVLTVLGVVLWAKMEDNKKKAEDSQRNLDNYRVEAAEKFAKKDEVRAATEDVVKRFEAVLTQVLVRLDRIESKIDQKADKND